MQSYRQYWAMRWDAENGRFVLLENIGADESFEFKQRFGAEAIQGWNDTWEEARRKGDRSLDWQPTQVFVNEHQVYESSQGLATRGKRGAIRLLAPSQALMVRKKLPPEEGKRCGYCGVRVPQNAVPYTIQRWSVAGSSEVHRVVKYRCEMCQAACDAEVRRIGREEREGW